MSDIDKSKVLVEYRDGVCEKSPVIGRKYTVTHSDVTGELYVTIGREYATDLFSEIRDELLLTIFCCDNSVRIRGVVQLDVAGKAFDREKRMQIFTNEMSKALQAVRYADHEFFEKHKFLDYEPILLRFASKDTRYDRIYHFGSMRDYQI